ncbi:MAG: hypothetical protein ABGZ35_07945, partial [Planctomycetaceae bacterium]
MLLAMTLESLSCLSGDLLYFQDPQVQDGPHPIVVTDDDDEVFAGDEDGVDEDVDDNDFHD